MSLLTVNDLSVSFVTRNGTTKAVQNISFSVEPKSITAIIGESGSGKSVSCYALLGLIPQPPGRVDRVARTSGAEICWHSQNVS